MKNKKNINVAVVGAGLTGLTTAFYLKKAEIPFVVFEKADRPGGVI
ncbi:MAG: FAD-dependent oxidoreductase, partial [Mariniphaga sp.]